jgi:hypothetical protein
MRGCRARRPPAAASGCGQGGRARCNNSVLSSGHRAASPRIHNPGTLSLFRGTRNSGPGTEKTAPHRATLRCAILFRPVFRRRHELSPSALRKSVTLGGDCRPPLVPTGSRGPEVIHIIRILRAAGRRPLRAEIDHLALQAFDLDPEVGVAQEDEGDRAAGRAHFVKGDREHVERHLLVLAVDIAALDGVEAIEPRRAAAAWNCGDWPSEPHAVALPGKRKRAEICPVAHGVVPVKRAFNP